MTDIATLVVRMLGDDTSYKAMLSDAESDAMSFAQRAQGGLAGVGSAIVNGSVLAAGAAFTGLGFLVKGAADEAMDAESILASLNSTLANTGPITGVTADMVGELAGHYQNLTRFEDDSITAGGEVLARFSEINSTVFPDALRLSLDLAEKFKTDVPSAASVLGKALADPGTGLMKLKAAGVVFNDEQEKMIQKMVDAGDVAGAQALIMDVVNQAVGGAAVAAGQTASGTWDRLRNTWGNVLETLGTGLIPAITQLGQTAMEYLNKPEVQAAIEKLGEALANLAMTAVNQLPAVIDWFKKAFGWLSENQGVIVGALAAIGVAIGAWVYTVVIPAAVAAIAAIWPVVLIMAAVAAVAYLIYQAWTQNWGGIQEKTAAAVEFLKTAINEAMAFVQQVINAAMTVIGPLMKAFTAAMSGDWYAFGQNLRAATDAAWKLVATAFSNAWGMIKSSVSTLITNTINAFKNTDWGDVGKNMALGIADGLKAALQFVVDSAIHVVGNALDAVKGFLGIASPSKKTERDLGIPIGQGVGIGVEKSLNTLKSRMPGMMNGLFSPQFAAARATTAGQDGMSGIQLTNFGTIQWPRENENQRQSLLSQLA